MGQYTVRDKREFVVLLLVGVISGMAAAGRKTVAAVIADIQDILVAAKEDVEEILYDDRRKDHWGEQ